MKRCPFNENPDKPCPMPDDWEYAFLRETCPDGKYGHNCAAILGQTMLAQTVNPETLRSGVDEELGAINAFLRLTNIPAGAAPLYIRESIAKVTYPLRQKRPVEPGMVFVSQPDLYFTLLNAEKLEEANWYNQRARQLSEGTDQAVWWSFDSADGVVNELASGPIDSIRQYDESWSPHSAAMSNTHLPPLAPVQLARSGQSGLSEVRPISDLFK